jgi:PAS domain S-box-containing protein
MESIAKDNLVLQAIIDCVSDWVWAVDVEGRYTYCCPKVEKYLGYQPDEMIGKCFHDFMNEGDAQHTRIAFRESAKQKLNIINLENWCIAKDGRRVLFSITGVPILDEADDLIGYRGVGTDLTEHRQMAENLRISEERYRLLAEHAGDVIWTMDVEGRFTYISPSVIKMRGYTPEEAMQQSWDDILCPDSLSMALERMAKHIADIQAGIPIPAYQIELEQRCKDGSAIWTDVTMTFVYSSNGDFQKIVAVTHDISEQKQRGAEIKRQSDLINALLDSAPYIIFFKDINGVYLGCNPLFAEFVGKSSDEIVGCTDYDLFDKQIADFFRDHDKRMLESGQTQHNEEWITYPDGRKILVNTARTPYIGEDGTLIGILGISRDITAQKKAEQEIQDMNQILQVRVEEETNRRIRQERLLANNVRRAAMGEMIAAISHQWRQPLSTLGMIVQRAHAVGTMQEGLFTQEYLNEFMASAMRQIMHMSSTIDDFRSFYRIDKKKVLFSPAHCILDALRLIEPQFASRGIEIDKQFQNLDSTQSAGFPNEFIQVIFNLLSNSGDAILKRRKTDGQPEVGRIAIDISVRENDSMIIDVRDNGCGIPVEFSDRVFDPYFTTKDESEGTGIGLYISRMIVEDRLDGRLSFIWSLDGATFRIELPLRDKS